MGGLMGLEKQIKANLYQTGWGLFRNGFVILAILIVPSLEMFFVWQTISTIVFTILFGLSLRKELTGVFKFDFQFQIENIVLKNIWRFAGGMLLINLIASINTQMDKLIISKLLLIENLGYYTLAVSLAMGILVLVNPISAAVLPRFTALYSAGEKKRASNLFYKLNLIVAILVFSIMANMTFFAKDIIWIWTGKMDLAEHAYRLIPVIVFAYSMLSLQVIPYNIAIANGYTKLNNYMGIISLFVTFPGYWFATTIYGPIGAAYVFCTVQTITTFIYLYVILKKFTINRSIISTYIFQIIFPLLITLAVAFMFSFIPLWVSSNRFISLTWIGIAIICSFFAATIILVPNVELKRIKNFIKIN
jgi:O-antigen/teichoic acid export membrane protein